MNSEMKAQSKKLLRKKPQTSKSPLNSWHDAVAGWVFIGPMFIGTSILVIFPILSSLTLSFTNWNIVAGYENAEFIGFDNFVALFNDPLFIKSLLTSRHFQLQKPVLYPSGASTINQLDKGV